MSEKCPHIFSVSALFLAVVLMMPLSYAHSARDNINIVGSSTVYPFATAVAEQFGKTKGFKSPKVESTGTGGGMKLFCGGVGAQNPDICDASRRIKATEVQECKEHGVTEIVEIKIGYDGIVLANSKKSAPISLTRKELFLALAKNVPAPGNAKKLVPNKYKTWRDINPSLPATRIEVLGPPPTSGTRDAFVELVMEKGAEQYDWLKALANTDKKKFQAIAHSIREDGAFIEAGENDNLIVQKLESRPTALGIFGFSFMDQNSDKIRGAAIDGAAPAFEAIHNGAYPVARPLYVYVKKAHVGVIPGIKEFLSELTSEKAWGDEGYLIDKGMIPMSKLERNANRAASEKLQLLNIK